MDFARNRTTAPWGKWHQSEILFVHAYIRWGFGELKHVCSPLSGLAEETTYWRAFTGSRNERRIAAGAGCFRAGDGNPTIYMAGCLLGRDGGTRSRKQAFSRTSSMQRSMRPNCSTASQPSLAISKGLLLTLSCDSAAKATAAFFYATFSGRFRGRAELLQKLAQ
jgi:hypothetical protein